MLFIKNETCNNREENNLVLEENRSLQILKRKNRGWKEQKSKGELACELCDAGKCHAEENKEKLFYVLLSPFQMFR